MSYKVITNQPNRKTRRANLQPPKVPTHLFDADGNPVRKFPKPEVNPYEEPKNFPKPNYSKGGSSFISERAIKTYLRNRDGIE